MVSKAREDLPDPETPVTTVMALWGTSKSMFLRLWTRAPRTTIFSLAETGIGAQKTAVPQGELRGVSGTRTFRVKDAPAGPGRMAETSYYSRSPRFSSGHGPQL